MPSYTFLDTRWQVQCGTQGHGKGDVRCVPSLPSARPEQKLLECDALAFSDSGCSVPIFISCRDFQLSCTGTALLDIFSPEHPSAEFFHEVLSPVAVEHVYSGRPGKCSAAPEIEKTLRAKGQAYAISSRIPVREWGRVSERIE